MAKTLCGSAVRYLLRHGVKRTVGAALVGVGRKLNSHLNMTRLDQHLGIRRRPLDDNLSCPAFAFLERNCDPRDIAVTREINAAWRRDPQRIRSVLWVMPDFKSVHNGGPNTILRFADYLGRQGIRNTILILNGHVHPSSVEAERAVAAVFGANANVRFIVNPSSYRRPAEVLPDADVAIATIWQSAHYLLPYHRTKAKFYFIQDYERLFYPAGHGYALADLSYDLGFLGICNTPGLAWAIRADHALSGCAFVPGIDRHVFYPPPSRPADDYRRLFFYGRPDVPRNGYELGIAGMRLIQEAFPDVKISIAGHQGDYDDRAASLKAEFLDYLPYEQTGELYRHCDMVLGFMFSPHPSYIPLQAMACGAIPICVRNPAITWAIRDGDNGVMAWPSPEGILAAYRSLRLNPARRARIRQRALASAPAKSWDAVLGRLHAWMVRGAPDELGGLEWSEPAHVRLAA